MKAPIPHPSSSRPPFRTLSDADLYKLPPEALLRYVAQAKSLGAEADARTAVHMLLFRSEDRIRERVQVRLPPHLQRHADTVADWVLERVARSALRLQVEGESVGQWVNWVETAVKNQIVSFWRSPQGQALEQEVMLPSEHEEVNGVHDTLSVDFDEERFTARLDAGDAISAVLARMTNKDHLQVVHAAFWEDRSSLDIAGDAGMTAANVDQVKSRFRKELRAELKRRGVTGDE